MLLPEITTFPSFLDFSKSQDQKVDLSTMTSSTTSSNISSPEDAVLVSHEDLIEVL